MGDFPEGCRVGSGRSFCRFPRRTSSSSSVGLMEIFCFSVNGSWWWRGGGRGGWKNVCELEWTELGAKGEQQIKTLEIFHFDLAENNSLFFVSCTSSPFLFFLLTPEENKAHLGSPPFTTSSSSSCSSLAGTVGTTRETKNSRVTLWNRKGDPTQFNWFDADMEPI